MRIRIMLQAIAFVIGLGLTCPTVAVADDYLIRIPYVRQESFHCKGQDFKIPTYFPYMDKWPDSKWILTAREDECASESLAVTLGTEATCPDDVPCQDVTFSVSSFSRLNAILDKTLSLYAQPVKLEGDVIGYFLPVQCGANCGDAELVWFVDGRVFIIASHYVTSNEETVREFARAANSYLIPRR